MSIKSPKNYSLALYQMVTEQPKQASKIVRSFIAKFFSSHKKSFLDKVVIEVSKIDLAHKNLQPVEVFCAKALTAEMKEVIAEYVRVNKLAENKELLFIEKIDQQIVGGVRFKINDHLVDLTYNNIFSQFNKQLQETLKK